MTNVTTTTDSFEPATDTAAHLFDNWFDAIESGVRERVRGFIEELIRCELDAALRARNADSGPASRRGRFCSGPRLKLPEHGPGRDRHLALGVEVRHAEVRAPILKRTYERIAQGLKLHAQILEEPVCGHARSFPLRTRQPIGLSARGRQVVTFWQASLSLAQPKDSTLRSRTLRCAAAQPREVGGRPVARIQ
jgi:hypothetical protein